MPPQRKRPKQKWKRNKLRLNYLIGTVILQSTKGIHSLRQSSRMLINTSIAWASPKILTWNSQCSKNQSSSPTILLSMWKTLSFSEIQLLCSKLLRSQKEIGIDSHTTVHRSMMPSGTVWVMLSVVSKSSQLRVFGQFANSTRLSQQTIRMSLTSKRGKCDEYKEILYVSFHFLSFWSCLLENYFSQLGLWFSQTQCHRNLWARKRRTNDLSNLKISKKIQLINWATFCQTTCRNW